MPSSSSGCPAGIHTHYAVRIVYPSGSCGCLAALLARGGTEGQTSQAATGRTGSAGEEGILQIRIEKDPLKRHQKQGSNIFMLNLKYLSLVKITCLNTLPVRVLRLYGAVEFLFFAYSLSSR